MSYSRKFSILVFNGAEAFIYLRVLKVRTYFNSAVSNFMASQCVSSSFHLLPNSCVCLVMEIILPTPFSDIIRFLSWTGGHGQLSRESNRHA